MKRKNNRVTKGKAFLTLANHKRSNALRMVAFSSVVIFVIVVAFSVLFYSVYRESLIEALIISNTDLLDRSDQMMDESFNQIENLALQLSLETKRLINRSDENIVHDYFRLQTLTNSLINAKNSHEYIHSVYTYFNQGNIIVTSFMGTTSFRLFHDTAWFDVYCKQSNVITWIDSRKPYDRQFEGSLKLLSKYSFDTESEVLTLLVPLSESLLSQGGAVIVNVYESEVARLLLSQDDNAETFIIDSEGSIILAANDAALHQSVDRSVFAKMQQDGFNGNFIRNENGEQWIYIYMPSRHHGNVIFMRIPLSHILQTSNTLLGRIVLIATILLVICCSLVVLLLRISYRPIQKLYEILGQSQADGDHADLQNALSSIIQNNKELTRLWDNNRTLIRHRTLSTLLQGHIVDNEEYRQRLSYMDIRFPHPLFACVLMHLDVPTKAHMLLDDEYELIKMQIFPLIRECLPPQVIGYTVDIDDLNIGIIVNSAEESPSRLLTFCESIRQNAASIVHYTLSFGIGTCVQGMENLPASFQSACTAASYAYSLGGNEIISASTISLSETDEVNSFPTNTLEQTLIPAVRIADMKAIDCCLDEFFSTNGRTAPDVPQAQRTCIRICNSILNMLVDSGIDISEATEMLPHDIFLDAMTVPELRAKLYRVLEGVCMRISEKHEHKNADTIEKILEFVRQNYWKDISLNQVAESVFMSVPYLCKVFKEYTGKTFNTYLTEVRLDSAILLLENQGNRIMDVATKCGFSNVQSFIRAFKKYKNMTPTEYRDAIIEHRL